MPDALVAGGVVGGGEARFGAGGEAGVLAVECQLLVGGGGLG